MIRLSAGDDDGTTRACVDSGLDCWDVIHRGRTTRLRCASGPSRLQLDAVRDDGDGLGGCKTEEACSSNRREKKRLGCHAGQFMKEILVQKAVF
jgi:hypothetical protein